MSGFSGFEDTASPLVPGSEEWKQFYANQYAQAHAAITAASAAPAAVVGSVVPDPKTGIPFTGLGSMAYGMGDLALKALTSDPGRVFTTGTGYDTASQPDMPRPAATGLPFASTVEEAGKRAYDRGKEIAPPMQPTSAAERVGQDAVSSAFSMGVPGTGALLKGLPAAAQVAAHVLAPGSFGGTSFLAGIGGAQGLADEAQRPPDAPVVAPDQPLPPVAGPLSTVPVDQKADTFGDGATRPPTFGAQDYDGPTYGGILGVAAGAVALIAGVKYAGRLGSSVANAARDARFQELSKWFNDQQAARWTGDYDATITPKEAAPLPGPAGGILKNAQTDMQNKNANLVAYLDTTAKTPDVATEMRAATGNINNAMAWDKRLTEQLRTGVDPHSGLSTPSFVDWSRNIADLDANQKQLLNYSLYAHDEIDNRMVNLRQAISNPTGNLNDPALRHNLYNQTSDQLRAVVAAGEADPAVKAARDTYYQMQRDNINIAQARGFITSQDATKVLNDRPHYVPTTDVNGNISHDFGARTTEPVEGVEQVPSLAWEAAKQHYEGIYRAMELNDWRRAIVYQGVDYQRRNPNAARMFTEKTSQVTGQGVAGPNENIVPISTDSGVKHFYVDNPDIYKVLSNSTGQTNTAFGALSYIRQLYQQGTTGIGALVSGRWFPPINMGRTALLMSTDRPNGMYGGMLDKAIQQATGGNLAYRGPDPTNFVGAPVSAAVDLGNNFARYLGGMLDPTATNPMNLRLRSIMSDAAVDALSTELNNHYSNSATAEMQAQGIGGQGSVGGTEPPAFQLMGGDANKAYSPANNLVPQLYRVYGPLGWATPTYVRLRNLVSEVSSAVSDGGHSYFYRLNQDNPNVSKNTLAYETRQLTGDPGTSGSGKITSALNALNPYRNITVQDNTRLLRVMKDAPIAGSLSLAANLGTAALGSIFSALVFGPAAVDHLQNLLSTQQREAGVTIYTDPDPTKNNTFSLPQRYRGLYAPILEMTATALGAFEAHKDEATYDRVMGTLRDFFSHHITLSGEQAAKHGFGEALDPLVGIPPWANAVANVAGSNVRPSVDGMYDAATSGQSVFKSMVHPLGADSRVPNQQGLDTLTGSEDGRVGQAILSSLFGIAGGAYGIATNSVGAAKATDDPMYGLGSVIDQWKQHFMDTAPYANNLVWSNQAKLSVRNPLEENVTRTIEALRPMLRAVPDLKGDGFTRTKGTPLVTPNDPTVPQDPQMQAMYMTAGRIGNFINGKFMPQVNDIKREIRALDTSPLREETKRDMHNKYAAQLNSKYQDIQGYITDLNYQLSKMAGTQVNVNSIKWHQPFTQFQQQPPATDPAPLNLPQQ